MRRNRAIVERALGVGEDKLLYLSQVHGVAAYEATGDERLATTLDHEGDVLFSGSPHVACGVRTADCVPILLAQPSTGAVAAVHAGWRGAVAGAPAVGVRRLRERFGEGAIIAAMGPHISAQAFEIGPEVAVALRDAAKDREIVAMRDGRLTGDLSALVRASLEGAGVSEIDHVAGGGVRVCDRGPVDGAAYWPGPDDLWTAVGTTREAQLRRYDAVIHLRTPTTDHGYNQANPLRIETASEAAAIDERIFAAWDGHPRRRVVEAMHDFLTKAKRALELIREALPPCCQHPSEPEIGR